MTGKLRQLFWKFFARPPFVLYFIHIPKTSGMTVDALIRSRVRPGAAAPFWLDEDYLRLPPDQLDQFDYFGGHLPFGYYLDQLVSRPVRRLVFVREPRATLLSMYKHVRGEPDDTMHAHVMRNCPDLEAFFHDPVMSAYVANGQTRFLALGEREMGPEVIRQIRAAPDEAAAARVRETFARPQPPPDDVLLGRAVARLRDCSFVGIAERLALSLDLLADWLRWPRFGEVPHLNQSADRRRVEDLPAGVVARLDELTVLDRALYEEALRLFGPRTA